MLLDGIHTDKFTSIKNSHIMPKRELFIPYINTANYESNQQYTTGLYYDMGVRL